MHAQPDACPAASPTTTYFLQEHKQRRVVVTGMGVVSCLGHELDEFYNNLLAGKSGISQIEVRV